MADILNCVRRVGFVDGYPVFYGGDVFKLMDSGGISLKDIVEVLRDRGVFDLHGFVRAAKVSGKYSNDSLRTLILAQERLHEVCAKMVKVE